MSEKLNLVDSLLRDPQFSSLAKVLTDAGLVEQFKEAGPFTILAPTNDAFSKVAPDQLTDLGKPENKKKLVDLLKYHVVPGKVMSSDIVKLTTAKTLQGQDIKIDASDGIKINGAKLQTRNFEATNGVIHAIDTVLAPAAAAKIA